MFRASGPQELLGVHAERVGEALQTGERLRYLLYSPMWEGSGGPFGILAAPASHAVAVTDRRFVISRDPHADGEPPALVSIPFDAVVSVESGSALMLAWLVIRHMEGGPFHSVTVLYRALGRHHFAAAIRAYRSATCSDVGCDHACPSTWPDTWHQIGERYREELEPLLIEGEVPLLVAVWPALNGGRRRRRRNGLVCVVPAGALVVSTHCVFCIGDDPRAFPRSPNFGINVLCVPFNALRAASLVDKTTDGAFALALRLEIGRVGSTMIVEIPFPGESLTAVENVLAGVASSLAAKDVAWSL